MYNSTSVYIEFRIFKNLTSGKEIVWLKQKIINCANMLFIKSIFFKVVVC